MKFYKAFFFLLLLSICVVQPVYSRRGYARLPKIDIAETLQFVWTTLITFYRDAFPNQEPSAKFYRTVYEIQRAVADELVSRSPRIFTMSPEKRQEELLDFMSVAAKGGKLDFARMSLGKALFTFMKKRLKSGLKITDLLGSASFFLKDIKNMIGTDNFEELIARNGDVTLMFTMDTTGSMGEEIEAAKAIAKTIVKEARGFEVDYILSPFNDPKVGPVIYKNYTQSKEIITALDSLNATGGGDCPEMVYSGILNALNAGPRFGSPMFVFTDASAKDGNKENLLAVKLAAYSAGSTINFFAKGLGCAKQELDYKEVAKFTSGQVFTLRTAWELRKFGVLVKSSLHSPVILSSGSGGSSPRRSKRSLSLGKLYTIPVDETVKRLIITITVQNSFTAKYVELYDPTGKVNINGVNLLRAKIYEIVYPKAGKWMLLFPHFVGFHDYVARALSTHIIHFGYMFLYKFTRRRSLIPVSHPLIGDDVVLTLTITSATKLKERSLRVDLLRVDGTEILSDLHFEGSHTAPIFRTQFRAFKQPFKLRLRGKTKGGFDFQRISRTLIKAKTAFVRPLYADKDFTVSSGGHNMLLFEIINRGKPGVFKISCKTQIGKAMVYRKGKMYTRRRGYFRVHYSAPSGRYFKGHVEKLTVFLQRLRGDELIYTRVKLLIL